jgi:hypothetical protein
MIEDPMKSQLSSACTNHYHQRSRKCRVAAPNTPQVAATYSPAPAQALTAAPAPAPAVHNPVVVHPVTGCCCWNCSVVYARYGSVAVILRKSTWQCSPQSAGSYTEKLLQNHQALMIPVMLCKITGCCCWNCSVLQSKRR